MPITAMSDEGEVSKVQCGVGSVGIQQHRGNGIALSARAASILLEAVINLVV